MTFYLSRQPRWRLGQGANRWRWRRWRFRLPDRQVTGRRASFTSPSPTAGRIAAAGENIHLQLAQPLDTAALVRMLKQFERHLLARDAVRAALV